MTAATPQPASAPFQGPPATSADPGAAPAVPAMTAGVDPKTAPFVGPRSYRIGERLFGRDRERLELLDLLIAERIVLLYSPSGAGKSSLVQAACVPALREEGFVVPAVARVTFDSTLDEAQPAANRYVFAVLLSLDEPRPDDEQLPVAELAQLTLPEYLDRRWGTAADGGGLVLILDQFEEILTVDPTDIAAKREFFTQLGLALRSRNRWALFSMREEHVAGLDPYRSLVPTRLAATYRLELLNEQQACQAMQQAAGQAGVDFTDAAARRLVDDLRRVRVERPGRPAEEQPGPTVEPVQLQVVCLRLWDQLAGKTAIEEEDIKALGSVDTALADYYAGVVGQLGERERFVRDWIEHELITANGLRNQVLREDAVQSPRVDEAAVRLLDERFLIREERRRGIRWLELAHDRLIEPVRSDNARWRDRHLTLFQRQAALWQKQGRPRHLELRGALLTDAEKWARDHADELTPVEMDFLKASRLSRRRKWYRVIIPAGAVAFAAVTAFGYDTYQNWLEARPWAYWTHLESGQSHELRDKTVSIGRTAQGVFKSRIVVEGGNVVSRLHLLIANDHEAHDMRSLNGTTVNARFLQYDRPQKLADGDLVVIAGMAAYRFKPVKPSSVPFLDPPPPQGTPLPGEAWALLIDGAARTAEPLLGDEYFLESESGTGRLRLTPAATARSLLRIGRRGELPEIETLAAQDGLVLLAMLKFEDRRYIAVQIPAGVYLEEYLMEPSGDPVSGAEYIPKMAFCFGPPQGRLMRIGSATTNVVAIGFGRQADCVIGPFQIAYLPARPPSAAP